MQTSLLVLVPRNEERWLFLQANKYRPCSGLRQMTETGHSVWYMQLVLKAGSGTVNKFLWFYFPFLS